MTLSERGWRRAAAAWALVIVGSGVVPTQEAVHAVSGGQDNLATSAGHFAAYAILGLLLGFAIGGRPAQHRRLLRALLLAACLGIAIEVIQAPLPYRDAQVVDVVVDIAGAALGLLLAAVSSAAWQRV